MRFIYSASADSTIYQEYSWLNAGADEILSIGKSPDSTQSVRSLIQFDLTAISSSIASGIIPISASFDFKLFVASAQNLSNIQQINIYEVSRSWVEGSGFFFQNINNPFSGSRSPSSGFFEDNGVTWLNRASGSTWSVTGSEFYTSSIISGTMGNPVVDMTFDITSYVRSWLSGSIENDGMLIKFPDSDEQSILNNGIINFFSRQTHTTYSPQLIAKWNDQQFITGSISGSNPATALVTIKNLRPSYKLSQQVRLDLSVRDRYPLRTFDTVFTNYTGNQRLPSSSYYSVVDTQSNTATIPFDQYSSVSCDGSGSYFIFKTDGLFPGRFYKIIIKVDDSGYENIYDNNSVFKVEF